MYFFVIEYERSNTNVNNESDNENVDKYNGSTDAILMTL